MGFHVFWPATACLTLFVVGIIMIMVKYGPNICGRNPRRYFHKYTENESAVAYAREISESPHDIL